ncbi:disintegrin and metalloproteinase domain-containing protein 28 isoform X2 [Erpetoichthys calabaricus]|uniref:disintegrin and metalloproteinase domain-containing protein 28 isoform X2 n=1 Tax=Erpetoichthys calabaricus TaxID=27687 RepID=UPI00109EFFB0|nr:disintegrin and metalloproteinase domain-containing protein 28 isoform X2 [Erpetoichthys calabaricus]
MSSFPVLSWIYVVLWITRLVGGSTWLEDIEDYEVVRLTKLHSIYKRDVQPQYPDTVHYGLKVDGKELVIDLEKNEGLIAQNYTETHYTKDGEKVTITPHDLEDCYYQGHIHNDSESMASISICDGGLRGFFQTAGQRYLIEPLQANDTGDHAVIQFEKVNETPAVCGVTNTTWDDNYPKINRVRSRGRSLTEQLKYVELFIVTDTLLYKKMKNDLNEVRKRVFEIVNYINVVYKPLKTFVALVGLEYWTTSDKISITAPAGATLDTFTKWRNSELVTTLKHDNAQLLTGIDFEGATVGLAYVGTMCSQYSTGVIQDHSASSTAVGATMAHEMGHNLGMSHDSSSCICQDPSCIMAPALSYNIPKRFSSCSFQNYQDFQSQRNPVCLTNVPNMNDVKADPVCGNGFLERGEECDCGTVEECTNICCNATTCKLTADSQCATGECCDNCKIIPAGTECRPSKDECDIPEACNGVSATCGENVFAVNGLPCQSGKGYCYNGTCPLLPDQCISMWGNDALVAPDRCFNLNTGGQYYAFCKRTSTGYIACQQKDVKCGKLFCTGGLPNPSTGRMVSIGDCKASFYDQNEQFQGLVLPGTRCGDQQVCIDNGCVDMQAAYRSANCSSKCKGQAVCNHRLECVCQLGWMPPDCTVRYSDIKVTTPGVIIGICVACLILVIICIITAVCIKKRQKQTSQQRYPSQQNTSGLYNPGFIGREKLDVRNGNNQYENQSPMRSAPAPPIPAGSKPTNRPVAPPPSVPTFIAKPLPKPYPATAPPPPPVSKKPVPSAPAAPAVFFMPTRPAVPTSQTTISPQNLRAALKPVNNRKV